MSQQVKTSLGVIIILIMVVTAGMFIWQVKKNQPKAQPATTQSAKPATASKQNQISLVNDRHTYKNEKYGFEIELPKSWDKYTIKDEINEDSNTGAGIALNIPISGKNIWVYNISVTPVSKWLPDACKEEGKNCTQGEFLGKNSRYVIEGYMPDYSIYGDPCLEKSSENYINDKDFCAVYKDIGKNNFVKNHFKIFEVANTADWQTYRNDKYGFEFQYPSQKISIVESDPTAIPADYCFFGVNFMSIDNGDVSVDRNISSNLSLFCNIPNPAFGGDSLEDYLKSNSSKREPLLGSSIDCKWQCMYGQNLGGDKLRQCYLQKEKDVYNFDYNYAFSKMLSREDFDLIVKSFKFTK